MRGNSFPREGGQAARHPPGRVERSLPRWVRTASPSGDPGALTGDNNAVMRALERKSFDSFLAALKSRGYTLLGPRVEGEAIVLGEIASAADLPAGWTDEQDGGHYRLTSNGSGALFAHAPGPQAWKRYLHPPRIRLFRATRGGGDGHFRVEREEQPDTAYAFLGVKACDLAAIAIQDRVFLEGQFVDPIYKARRERAFLVAVNCTRAGGTCFCASMGTGPKARAGFDLALTEVVDKKRHFFLVEAGSERGEEVLAALDTREATDEEVEAGERAIERAAAEMGRDLETEGLHDVLYRQLEHPRWEATADRCLNCGNCTLVCPTCFCTSVEDTTDLAGLTSERWRRWDSCFNLDFSYLHGGSVRTSGSSRYRQWLTHKLASWQDQFGTSGCVGCGRCITWCPVGIDITEEAGALRADDEAHATREEAR